MKILIIGITGRIGKRVAGELLRRDQQVRGVNRRPERVSVVLQGLPVETARCDTADYDEVLRQVDGMDVVFLATAPTREHPEAYVPHNANVIRACKEAGVGRLVAMSNYMALRAPNGAPMMEHSPPHPAFRAVEEQFPLKAEMFRREQVLDWLLVAPPVETYPYGEVTGAYRIGGETLLVSDAGNPRLPETSVLSMEDLAHFAALGMLEPRYHRQLITLAY